MVKVLDEYGADATKRNMDDICAIDISITEDIKDIKFHFTGLSQYRNFDFTGMQQETSSSLKDIHRGKISVFTSENT